MRACWLKWVGRDWSISADYIWLNYSGANSVDIYPDRIEIKNPGGLWGGKTVDNLADGESRCRNSKLMSLMGATPLEHAEGAVAESQGSGIPAMIREMESRSLGRPKFIVKADSFTVLLSRHGAELAENRTWIQSHVGTELTDREETLLMFMREHGCVCDVQKIREALKWDSDDIRLICGDLVDKHVLSKCGKDTYEIIDMNRESSASTADRILEALSAEVDMTAREIAVASGVRISSVRYHLPKMADKGLIEVMGSSTSHNRRYRKK